jgi:hypothetical protein
LFRDENPLHFCASLALLPAFVCGSWICCCWTTEGVVIVFFGCALW